MLLMWDLIRYYFEWVRSNVTIFWKKLPLDVQGGPLSKLEIGVMQKSGPRPE